jgi:hypothetical protein
MLKPKDNYLKTLRGEVPDYPPSMYEPYTDMLLTPDPNAPRFRNFGTPINAPNGPEYSPWGVRFVGSPENNFGAIPEPGFIILDDITKWRDVIKNPDITDVDWEDYFRKFLAGKDRDNFLVQFGGSDYFQTLISFMGFTDGLMAMFEEPDEVYELFEYISEYYVYLAKQQLYYAKPDVYMIADDCAAAKAPFFSPDMYRRLVKPFHKKVADLCNESGVLLARHDCGRSEDFIDDWLELGIRSWNPAQTTNDLKAIKKKYLGKLTLEGCWDNQGRISMPETSDDELMAAVEEYVATFAPGGGFVYMPMVTGSREDPNIIRKSELIKDYYFSHVKNFYN